MAEMLLINPRRRRRAAAGKRRATPPRVRRTTARRRRNPMPALSTISTVRRRRANPIRAKRRMSRRRRNPIGMGGRLGTNKIFSMLKDAAIGGAGSVAVDYAMGMVNNYLPLTMRKVPGQVGVYDAIKVGVTVALGHFLSKPTRGLSQKAAMGALTVQAAGLIKTMLPVEVGAGLGYYSPAPVARGSGRIGPARSMAAYTRGGNTPLLSAYTGGSSPLLSGSRSATLQREGVVYR